MWTLLLLAGLSSASSAPATKVIARAPAQLAAVEQAERIGRDLYDFDQAAWGATDALVAAMPDPAKAGVRGWIVERENAGTVAIFYGLNGNQPYKVFVAHMQGRKVLSQHIVSANDDRGMTAIERRMADARAAVMTPETLNKVGVRQCGKGALNTVVLPPATIDGIVPVYVLAPQATISSFPLGGHYRIDVAANGSIAGSRPFTNSCIAMDLKKAVPNPLMFFVTHVLDPQPTEIHVWISLASRVPLGVAIASSGDVWAVADGKMKYQYTLQVDDPAKK
ncbi:hypothetical protein [Sphingomonas crusticola]|uniref:hypothetical protein n=1 Tax=Sphingomonas crusticola TaxID=1697973 RepID=UPI000E26A5A3|nr:hypothetical protein [Sphingomonas crusticola]